MPRRLVPTVWSGEGERGGGQGGAGSMPKIKPPPLGEEGAMDGEPRDRGHWGHRNGPLGSAGDGPNPFPNSFFARPLFLTKRTPKEGVHKKNEVEPDHLDGNGFEVAGVPVPTQGTWLTPNVCCAEH